MSVMRRKRAGALRSAALALACTSCAGQAPATQHGSGAQGELGELAGQWLQYWSVAGEAESQRYTFLDNGEFRWAAAPTVSAPAAGTPLRKVGRWEIRQSEQGRSLILHVLATDLAGCDSACDSQEGRAFHVEHSPALLEEIELGECAPNAEARRIDAGYACVAFAEHAFWRRPVEAAN